MRPRDDRPNSPSLLRFVNSCRTVVREIRPVRVICPSRFKRGAGLNRTTREARQWKPVRRRKHAEDCEKRTGCQACRVWHGGAELDQQLSYSIMSSFHRVWVKDCLREPGKDGGSFPG